MEMANHAGVDVKHQCVTSSKQVQVLSRVLEWLNPVCAEELTSKSRLGTPYGQNTHNSRYCIPASHALSLIVNELISVTSTDLLLNPSRFPKLGFK